jgi:hypothetical protein
MIAYTLNLIIRGKMAKIIETLNTHKTVIGTTLVAGISILAQVFPKQANVLMKYAGLASDHIEGICDIHDDLVEKYGTDLDQIIAELPPKTKRLVESVKNIADTAKNDKLELLEKFYSITDIVKYNAEGLTESDLEGFPIHLKKSILSMDEKVASLQRVAESAEHLKEALDIAQAENVTYSNKILGILDKIDESDDHLTPEDLAGLPSGFRSVLTKMDTKIEHFKTLAETAQSIEETIDAINTNGETTADEAV